MNVFSFTGRLGRDVDVRHTSTGVPLASFTAANDIGFGDKKRTQWIKCTLWGKLAESGVIPYLVKGREVAVTGEIALDEYTGRDGASKASLSVRVTDLTLVGAKTESLPQPESDIDNSAKDAWLPLKSKRSYDFDDELPF